MTPNIEHPVAPMIDALVKALTAKIVSIDKRGDLATIARSLFPNTKGVTECAINPGDYIRRAVSNPAMTTVSGWASELTASKVNVDFISALAPNSTYAALTALGLRIDLQGAGTASIPAWSTVASGLAFVPEGQPISVRQKTLTQASMTPKKAALISVYSAEIANHSTPSIENVLRAGLESDIYAEIDTVLLGTGAASAAQPAGIRNGATAVTATTGGGIAALGGDLGALASAVTASGPVQVPTYLMNPVDLVRALTLSPGLNSDQVTLISSPYLPAKTVVFLDASAFASAARDEPEIVISKEATLVTRSDAVPITDAAGARGTPTLDSFQQDLFAIRILVDLTWGVIPARVATVSAVTW
jgi:hypothetical protein